MTNIVACGLPFRVIPLTPGMAGWMIAGSSPQNEFATSFAVFLFPGFAFSRTEPSLTSKSQGFEIQIGFGAPSNRVAKPLRFIVILGIHTGLRAQSEALSRIWLYCNFI
jgi:hypothetical protein